MASVEGTRRQLPPWMLQAKATDQTSNSGSQVKCKKSGLKVLPREGCNPSSAGENQQQPVEVVTLQSESTMTDSGPLKKCRTTRGRRKLAKGAEDSDCNVHGGDVQKENYAPPRRKRKAKVSVESRSNATEKSSVDEDTLTVDDLISVAKEYINAEKGQQLEPEILLPPVFSKDIPARDEDANPSSNGISNVEISEASLSGSLKRKAIERGVVSPSEPEDFALDMLDLYLGGALKRSKAVK